MKLINLDTWKRKEHFEFFSQFENPNLGLVTEVNCTKTYLDCKKSDSSFFATYMHKSMRAVNAVPEFKYRIIDGKVYELDIINAGTTIGRSDGTFAFAYVLFSDNFHEFEKNLKKEVKAVEESTGLRLAGEAGKVDLIRHTTIPWIHFSGLLHPTMNDKTDSVPKISFGKASLREGEYYLPISVEAHHGLVDGVHVAQYLEKFQQFLNE